MLMFWLKCNDVYETAGADPRFSDGGGGGVRTKVSLHYLIVIDI